MIYKMGLDEERIREFKLKRRKYDFIHSKIYYQNHKNKIKQRVKNRSLENGQ